MKLSLAVSGAGAVQAAGRGLVIRVTLPEMTSMESASSRPWDWFGAPTSTTCDERLNPSSTGRPVPLMFDPLQGAAVRRQWARWKSEVHVVESASKASSSPPPLTSSPPRETPEVTPGGMLLGKLLAMCSRPNSDISPRSIRKLDKRIASALHTFSPKDAAIVASCIVTQCHLRLEATAKALTRPVFLNTMRHDSLSLSLVLHCCCLAPGRFSAQGVDKLVNALLDSMVHAEQESVVVESVASATMTFTLRPQTLLRIAEEVSLEQAAFNPSASTIKEGSQQPVLNGLIRRSWALMSEGQMEDMSIQRLLVASPLWIDAYNSCENAPMRAALIRHVTPWLLSRAKLGHFSCTAASRVDPHFARIVAWRTALNPSASSGELRAALGDVKEFDLRVLATSATTPERRLLLEQERRRRNGRSDKTDASEPRSVPSVFSHLPKTLVDSVTRRSIAWLRAIGDGFTDPAADGIEASATRKALLVHTAEGISARGGVEQFASTQTASTPKPRHPLCW